MTSAADDAVRAAASRAYDLARAAESLLRLATNYIDDDHLVAPVTPNGNRADRDDIARTMEVARWLCGAVQDQLEPHNLDPHEAAATGLGNKPPWTLPGSD